MAFQQADGKVAWAKHDFGNVYSSPILINVGGLEQLARADGRRADRRSIRTTAICSGRCRSRRTTRSPSRRRCGVPATCCSSRPSTTPASKVIELQRNGLQTTATELWSSNRLRLHHGNAMRIGDTIYFSSGGKGSQAILTRGRRAQRQDPLAGAQHREGDVRVGRQKLITLEQDGNADDRASVAAGVQDRREGAAADRAVVDAAGAGRARGSTFAIGGR